MTMRRVEVVVKGDVQKVGYRIAVEQIARRFGIAGYIQNLEPRDMKIVAEGEEAVLKEFLKAIDIQDRLIKVESLEVTWAEATGEFPYFRILRGDWHDELDECLDTVIAILSRSIEVRERILAEIMEERLMADRGTMNAGEAAGKGNLTGGEEAPTAGRGEPCHE